jgi:hypothetical protein
MLLLRNHPIIYSKEKIINKFDKNKILISIFTSRFRTLKNESIASWDWDGNCLKLSGSGRTRVNGIVSDYNFFFLKKKQNIFK